MAEPKTVHQKAERPQIGVAMATFNGAAFIDEQIDSILSELGEGDQLLIVDDDSSDETVELIRKKSDPRIILLQNVKNRGYVHTFERALSEVGGEVIFLSDQDDAWMPGRVDAMLEALGDQLLVVSNWQATGGKPGRFERIRLRPIDSCHHLRNIIGILVGYRLHWGCAMAVRQELLNMALPFPSWMNESHDQYLAMAANVAQSIRYMAADTVWHRLHAANLTPLGARSIHKILSARARLVGELFVLMTRRIGEKAQNS